MTAPLHTLTVHAGRHNRLSCPMRVTFPNPLPPGNYALRSSDGHLTPLQHTVDAEYAFIESGLQAGESRSYALVPSYTPSTPAISIVNEHDNALAIAQNGRLITRYQYAAVKARPYFYPLHAPNGVSVTRAYPMIPDAPDEMRDHPHHRSLWIAFGEVNETDNWSEEAGHGHTEHQKFDRIVSGAVFGQFASRSLWTTANSEPLLDQSLAVTIWATDQGISLLDFDILLAANYGAVHFGDTKEGGILSVRVATSLDVPRTGEITNSFGGINEDETWGKAAHWCDYSGIVQECKVGVALCDHPLSFRYPTHWHVRNYGLMTANPFGYSYYTQGLKNGAHTLQQGETLPFHYRMILHKGDAIAANLAERYLDFVAPPKVTLEPA